MVEKEFGYPPQFDIDQQGKATTAIVEVKAYIKLLVRANVIDAALWPPGYQEGATALRRVRQIEAECAAQQGRFDWEKLPPVLQDEYDLLAVQLDRLQAGNEDTISWDKFKRGQGGT